MPLANTPRAYGSLARSLHWLTALLILTAIPLGLVANATAFDSAAALTRKAQLFSLHKTLGVAAFTVALARITVALIQPRPVPLHPGRRFETWAAETAHWTLYIALLAVPLTGWVHHAATSGFAPILWPLGQDLPFVAKSEPLAQAASALHGVFGKLLAAAIVLHAAGALKHVLIDRDATLARMLRGISAGASAPHPRSLAPALSALALYAAGAGLAFALISANPEPEPAAGAALPAASGNWRLEDGSLGFSVAQLGMPVRGSFADWTAAITFDAASGSGTVAVQIMTSSLSIGSVTEQARSAEFFDTATYPTASFQASIRPEAGGYIAEGSLALRGMTLPLSLPFSLEITGDSATMQGTTRLDRRDYQMGVAYPDESSVGFGVDVSIRLTATRQD
ncbi:MAG: cytochrome b/b6 domain-containing protein [Pseudorhodobacter sp.]|nr:cytochrome b/b6 domain-containing protein [Pseudorhodobacter sp.]